MNDYIVKCLKHNSPINYVQVGSNNPFKCVQCEDLDFDRQLVNFGDWVQKAQNIAQEAYVNYKCFVDIVGKQVWDQIQTLFSSSEQVCKVIQEHCSSQRQKIKEHVNQAKELILSRLDQVEKSLEEQVDRFQSRFNETAVICQKVIQQVEQCQYSCAYQVGNSLTTLLQQGTTTELSSIYETLINLEQASLFVMQERKQYLKFRQAAQQLTEQAEMQKDGMLSFQLRQSMQELGAKVYDDLLRTLVLTEQVPRKRTIHSQQRPSSPMSIAGGKENNYFSHNPQVSLVNGPGGLPQTPLSSVRPLQKQYSMPTENRSISKSPKRVTPSPLRTPIISTDPPLMAVNGNKTLLMNQLSQKTLKTSDLTLKPLKKYQIDFPVAAVEVVSENVFALLASNDPYLRIFDTTQKRIHTLQAHTLPIIGIDKSSNVIAQNQTQILKPSNLSTPLGQKTPIQKYLVTVSLDSIVIWVFECTKGTENIQPVPQILHKVKSPDNVKVISYLQDCSSVAIGDCNGSIMLYNFQSQRYVYQSRLTYFFQKQLNPLEKHHVRGITNMLYVQKQRRLICISEDSQITVWRSNNQIGRPSQIESLTLEQSITNLSLGAVRTLNCLLSDQDLIVIGNTDGKIYYVFQSGQVKLINLQMQAMELEVVGYTSPVVDMVIAEETNLFPKEDIQFCVFTICNQMKQLRLWKVQRQGTKWLNAESKVEIVMQLGDSLSKSKLQFVQLYSSGHYILIANENGKELLVYEVTSK